MSDDFKKVRYIGFRPSYREGLTGLHITFKKDQVIEMPFESAMKLLRHPSVFAEVGKGISITDEPTKKVVKEEKESDEVDNEFDIQMAKDALQGMDEDGLRSFAASNFAGYKIPATVKKRETLIGKITTLIDQYGIPK